MGGCNITIDSFVADGDITQCLSLISRYSLSRDGCMISRQFTCTRPPTGPIEVTGPRGRNNACKQNTQGINHLSELPVSQCFTSAFLFEIALNIIRSERSETTPGLCFDKNFSVSDIPATRALWYVVRRCFLVILIPETGGCIIHDMNSWQSMIILDQHESFMGEWDNVK
jgi:hypothetical protein